VKTCAEECGIDIGVMQHHEVAPVFFDDVEAFDFGAMGDDFVVDTEFAEDGHAGGLEEEAGTDGAGFGGLFEDFDVVASTFQENGGGGTCGTATDDGDA
jgi:hypothetical protein